MPNDTAAPAGLSKQKIKRRTSDSAKTTLVLSSSPHIGTIDSVPKIMWHVVIALLLPMAGGVFFFGPSVLLIIAAAVAAALAAEAICNYLRGQPLSLLDGSAILTGLILALTLPPSIPWPFAALGAAFAIIVGKQVFGGLGHNIFNPALLGRAFLQASFPIQLTTWSPPRGIDAITSATPLGSFKFTNELTPYFELFIGRVGGSIGETSALLILVSGLYLVARRFADWRIPASFLGTVCILASIMWLFNPEQQAGPLFHLLAGGLLFGSFFMATDMVTSPITPVGSWIFGAGCGLVLILIRLFGGLPEGVMYSILFMNAFVPLINRATRPRIFGEVAK